MRPNHTLILALASTALMLGGCSEKNDDAAAPAERSAEAASDAAAPQFDGAVAPGVAFAYRYAFTLPGDVISKVQNQHAAACEKLGLARCRVTGMDYRQQGDDSVTARIEFLLAPDLAHRFGRDAAQLVEEADGSVADADISGDNAGGAIELSQQNSAAVQAELARIEARLGAKGLGADERQGLIRQAAAMRDELRGEARLRMDKEKAIASTPVSFAYASEGVFGGSGDPLGKAASASWSSMTTMLAFALTMLGLAAPWALLAGLVWLAWRGLRAKSAGAKRPATDNV